MHFRKKNFKAALIIYWLMICYFIVFLFWWYVELNSQNIDMANHKLNDLQKTDVAYQLKVAAIKKEEKGNFYQFIGEGALTLFLILAGASYLIKQFKNEVKSVSRQQSFMMAITHELKTPIAIAKLNLETIQKHSLNEIQLEKLLNNTLQETNRLDTLCNNLLISSQIEEQSYETTKEAFDFSIVVNKCNDDFSGRYPQRVFNSSIEEGTFIFGDNFLLTIMVNNLLENAIKYSPKEKPISILLNNENNNCILKIVDEGSGIPENEKLHVFKKNYRLGNSATKAAKGTGLGLYIASRVAKTHDAKITIDTNPLGGCIFIFTQKVIKHKDV